MSDDKLESTKRFSSRVADYVKYRPSYPAQVVNVCTREMGMTPASIIADIGQVREEIAIIRDVYLRLGEDATEQAFTTRTLPT